MHSPVELCREAFEARKDFFGEPDVRLVWIVLAAYFVAFLLRFNFECLGSMRLIYLDVRDGAQVLLQFVTVFFVAEGLRDFFEAGPGVASVDCTTGWMGC